MTIFYSPYPSAQPGTSNTQFKVGDVYVSSKTVVAVKGTLTPILWNTYASSSPTYPTALPQIVASSPTPTYTANSGQTFIFNAVTAYGGTAVSSNNYATGGTASTYKYSISPALPTGLNLVPASLTATTTIVGLDNITRAYNYISFNVQGTPTAGLAATTYTVTLTDGAGQTTNVSFTLTVSGTQATLQATTAVSTTTATQFKSLTSFIPVTAQGGVAPLSYAINPSLPSGLSLNTGTGAVSGTPTVTSGQSTYNVTITDSTQRTANATFNLSVVANPVVLTLSNNNFSGTQSILFASTATASVVTGSGTAPYTWSINPALPTGLTLNSSNGQLSGTPTIASPSTLYTITVTDANLQTATASITLVINALPLLNTTLQQSTISLIRNTNITSVQPVVASGGYGTISYAISTALPTGLLFNTGTGYISGITQSAISNVQYTVTATDQASQSSSKTFSLTVSSAALTATTVSAYATDTVIKSVAISSFVPVTATGGYGTYTYSISPGLPTGLSFSTTLGTVSGTATTVSNTTSYAVSITDLTPQTTSSSFSLNVVLPAAVTATTLASVTTLTQSSSVGTPFTPVTATGGYPTLNGLTYAISPALSSGLSFNQGTGAISGTPSTYSTATTTYTVRVTDTLNQTSSTTFGLYIQTPTFTVTTGVPSQTLVKSVASNPFTPVTASGGTTVYSYSVAPSLPSGLTFSTSTGAVTGTPTVAGSTSTYTVTISDTLSHSGTGTFSIYVRNPQPVVTTQAVTSTTLIVLTDTANFTPVTASGGENGITFSVTPTLPSGLNFSLSTGKITQIAHAVSSTATYTVFATDGIGQTSSSTFNLAVIAQPLVSTLTTSSISLNEYTTMSPTTPVTVIGGTAPYAYSVSPGLPSGITLSTASGQISGTPTVASNTSSYIITVTDSVSVTTSRSISIYIAAAVSLTATTAVSNVSATVTQSLTQVKPVVATGGYASVYTYTITPALPSGLTFNTATGYISGTASVLSTSSLYTVTVTDYAATTASNSFNLAVNPIALTNRVTAPGSAIYVIYSAITPVIPVAGVGGYGSLNYVFSPSLPQGIDFNPTTGQISGTPTVQQTATTYTVTISDNASQTTTGTFSLTVNDVPHAQLVATLNNTSITSNVGVPASFTPVSATGGATPYSYAITGTTALPAGLSFDTTSGTISGTASTTASTATYFISITDQVPQTVQQSFTLNVTNPPILNPTSFQVLTVVGTNASTSPTTGALIVAGGVGIGGTVNIANTSYINGAEILTTATASKYEVTSVNAGTDTAINTTTGAVTVWATSTLESVTSRGATTDHPISITNTTAATNATSGALKVSGGIGIQGSLYAGTTSYVAGAEIVTTATLSSRVVTSIIAGTDIAITTSTGVVTIRDSSTLESITKRGATTDQPISINTGTVSSSPQSGALVVVGGTGVGGDLNVGGNLTLGATVGGPTVVSSIESFTISAINSGSNINLYPGTSGSVNINRPLNLTYTATNALSVSGGATVQGLSYFYGTATFYQPTVTVAQPSIYDQSAITVDTSAVTLDSFDSRLYRTAEYTVSISNTGTSEYQTTRIILIHDGTTPSIEVTSVFTGQRPLVEFSAVIANYMVILQGTGQVSTNKIKVKPAYITI
jgi:hypothetical protein